MELNVLGPIDSKYDGEGVSCTLAEEEPRSSTFSTPHETTVTRRSADPHTTLQKTRDQSKPKAHTHTKGPHHMVVGFGLSPSRPRFVAAASTIMVQRIMCY